ncbi:hypothetical protein BDF21DRAFT_464977 [Thamnidium elegans]|nr:hypothetical protein BDF21DRAFT_464977 [Thamnidium elegans]
MKLEKRINKLKEENTYYKSLNKEKINNNIDDKINKHLEERLNNINTLELDIDDIKEIDIDDGKETDICEDCGFEINENGCICPDICKNEDCENYDEDEYNEICNICKNKLDEEVDELCEESHTLSDIEMEEEFYNENSSKTIASSGSRPMLLQYLLSRINVIGLKFLYFKSEVGTVFTRNVRIDFGV